MDDRERLLLLNAIPDIGTIRVRNLLGAFGGLRELFDASEPQVRQVEGIGPVLARRIVEGCRDSRVLDEELRLATQAGCAIITRLDEGFPAPLLEIPDPPLVLYMSGRWHHEDQTAVAVVGSRRASLYGQHTAERMSYDLAVRGVTVVSGLARGIDSAAHRGALKARGRTLAVLGSGLNRLYPPEHEELAEQIAASGAVISEYPMGMAPLAQNFPRRNRLISGLSLGVVIVEAAGHSGALITADCALEQGREVFAVPGKVDSVTSQGTHRLLKQGAKLTTTVDDILEELRLEPIPAQPGESVTPMSRGLTMTDEEQQLLAHLASDEPQDLDALAVTTGFSVSACAAALLGLELKRLVKQLPGKRFIVSGSAAKGLGA